ncbi:Nitrilase family, member 2 [Seminavis robusta]|uniref:Nitrilase family, member 2 n=1 Tax=Seminavis robusta TaxID=568900 RepID=A0A9N8H7U8_9STRA|nr:Nitrilase family, member 2 [Seminavis robusta]|eukprot:Sro150_g069010.1 Nitrilase family, member 2 (298) ;mRNA; f:100225-101678
MSANDFRVGDEEDEIKRPDPFPYSETEDVMLPEDYAPTRHDVINGRGRKSYNHIANRRFRQLIAMNLERYLAARCKVDKTLVVVGIVDTIRNAKPTGGFLKRCPKTARWISLSDESAREKVGHCLRDMIASQRDNKKSGKGAAKKTKAAVRAAAAAMSSPGKESASKGPPMMNNMWQPRAPDGLPAPKAANPMADPASFAMWASFQDGRNPAMMPPLQPPMPPLMAPPNPPPAAATSKSKRSRKSAGDNPPVSLNNLDTVSLQKGNLQDMSEQQRRILSKLENGWKGTVEELMEAVK